MTDTSTAPKKLASHLGVFMCVIIFAQGAIIINYNMHGTLNNEGDTK